LVNTPLKQPSISHLYEMDFGFSMLDLIALEQTLASSD
jgi:hypothetical protein